MTRAVMEGICYGMHSVFDALQGFGAVRDIRMSGSFTKSPLWMQILADVLGEPLVLPSNSEGAAYGAAVRAAGLPISTYTRAPGTTLTEVEDREIRAILADLTVS